MTELLPEVDAETLTVEYLTWSLADLITGSLGGVSGRLPANWTPSTTWIRVTLARTTDADRGVGHVTAATVEVEVFGADALTLYGIAARALRDLRQIAAADWTFPGAVVTDGRKESGIENRPDEESDAERYTFRVVLTLHPVAL